eukprot:TRINITY_DN20255_c0_g7_i1.p1 TRINITY_DN20255_c0_g7~~TRINITY_DN20255_c0_g7_i1.p1  ORF type:complete len:475 (-),score=69.09 TRINITY_DN20255_c0_g7_i1:114-1538(-)
MTAQTWLNELRRWQRFCFLVLWLLALQFVDASAESVNLQRSPVFVQRKVTFVSGSGSTKRRSDSERSLSLDKRHQAGPTEDTSSIANGTAAMSSSRRRRRQPSPLTSAKVLEVPLVTAEEVPNSSTAHQSVVAANTSWHWKSWQAEFLQLERLSSIAAAALGSSSVAIRARVDPTTLALSFTVGGCVLFIATVLCLCMRSEPKFGPQQESGHLAGEEYFDASPKVSRHPSASGSPTLLASRRQRESRSLSSKDAAPQSDFGEGFRVFSAARRSWGSSSSTDPGSRQRWLCPSLVVPSGMELVFAVRELFEGDRVKGAFSILDLTGQALSHVRIEETTLRCSISLFSLDDRLLASVRTKVAQEKGSQAGPAEVCWPSGEVFGTVCKDEPVPCGRYTLRDTAGQKVLSFHGNFLEKAINVVNARGRLVCDTERCSILFDDTPHYQVRVAPGIDAGLVLCGLLAIDYLVRLDCRQRS